MDPPAPKVLLSVLKHTDLMERNVVNDESVVRLFSLVDLSHSAGQQVLGACPRLQNT